MKLLGYQFTSGGFFEDLRFIEVLYFFNYLLVCWFAKVTHTNMSFENEGFPSQQRVFYPTRIPVRPASVPTNPASRRPAQRPSTAPSSKGPSRPSEPPSHGK